MGESKRRTTEMATGERGLWAGDSNSLTLPSVTSVSVRASETMAELSGVDRLWLGLLRAPLSWWARPHVLPEDLQRRFATRRPAGLLRAQSARRRRSHRAREGLRGVWTAAAPGGAEAAAARTIRSVSSSAARVSGAIASITAFPPPCASWSAQPWPIPRSMCDLMPVTVLWGRAPDKADSWLRMLLVGELGASGSLPAAAIGARERPQSVRAIRRSGVACERWWMKGRMRRAPCVALRGRCG